MTDGPTLKQVGLFVCRLFGCFYSVKVDAIIMGFLILFLTAFIAHVLTKDRDIGTRRVLATREAEQRRLNFQKYVLLRRYQLERIAHHDDVAVWRAYEGWAPELIAEGNLVVGDFYPVTDFVKLVRQAGEWRREDADKAAQVRGHRLRDVLRDSLVELYLFTAPKEAAYFSPEEWKPSAGKN